MVATKKMSQKKFFELLEKRNKKYGFAIGKDCLGIRERTTHRCPLSAVANDLGIKLHKACDPYDAADELNLDSDFADSVACAADDYYESGPEKSIRKRLLKTLNLKELD